MSSTAPTPSSTWAARADSAMTASSPSAARPAPAIARTSAGSGIDQVRAQPRARRDEASTVSAISAAPPANHRPRWSASADTDGATAIAAITTTSVATPSATRSPICTCATAPIGRPQRRRPIERTVKPSGAHAS